MAARAEGPGKGFAARAKRGTAALVGRVRRSWAGLAREQRLAGGAALALFFTMFLPWYSKSYFARGRVFDDDLTAFGAFSFVEAAVLLVAAFVLAMLFARGERRAFHLPGGDGAVIMGAGLWAALLIAYRLFDAPDVKGTTQVGATIGLQWGIFIALLAACVLAYAGWRVRGAHRPEPPLPAAEPDPRAGADEAAPTRAGTAGTAVTRRVAPDAMPTERVARDAMPTERVARDAMPTERVARDAMPTERVARDPAIGQQATGPLPELPAEPPVPEFKPGGRRPRPRRSDPAGPAEQPRIPGMPE